MEFRFETNRDYWNKKGYEGMNVLCITVKKRVL
jgi:hypothetical protein